MKPRHLVVLAAGLTLGLVIAGDRAQQPWRVVRRSARPRRRRRSWPPVGRWSSAAWWRGCAGPRVASACCSSPRGPPGFSPSSTTPVWARRSSSRSGWCSSPCARRSWRTLRLPTRAAGSPAASSVRGSGRVREYDRSCSDCCRRWSSTPPRRDARNARTTCWLSRASPGSSPRSIALGLVLGLVWALVLAALAVWRIVSSSAAARLLVAPVVLAAARLPRARRRRLRAQPRPRLSLQRRRRQAAVARAGGGAGEPSRSVPYWPGRADGGRERRSRASSSSSATHRRPADCATRSPLRSTTLPSSSPTRSATGATSTRTATRSSCRKRTAAR